MTDLPWMLEAKKVNGLHEVSESKDDDVGIVNLHVSSQQHGAARG